MVTIVRGTTPTFKYTFKTIDVSDIASAYMTFRVCNNVLLEKDLSSAFVEEAAISWTLTQEETLALPCCYEDGLVVRLNWKLSDGTRGVSRESIVRIEHNTKEVVI